MSHPVEGGVKDASLDVIVKSARYEEPYTIVLVSRSLNTGDVDDVVITVKFSLSFNFYHIIKLSSGGYLTETYYYAAGISQDRMGFFLF